MRAAETPPVPVSCNEDLSVAAAQTIRAPLAALRASMESMVQGLDRSDPHAAVMQGALQEIVRLGRSVQVLLDYAIPAPVRPLSCSLEEIVRSALHGLDPERRARVLSAVEDPRSRLLVDGPLLSRCLGHLVVCGLESTSDTVLVRARAASGQAVFALFGAEGGGRPEASLGAALARREIARLGGALSSSPTRGPRSVVEIRVPLAPGAEERP